MWNVIIFVPDYLIAIFSSDKLLIKDAVPALKTYFAAFIFMDLQYIGQTVFKSLNKKKQAIFFSLLRKVFIVVPLTYLLPYVFKMGTHGVFLAELASRLHAADHAGCGNGGFFQTSLDRSSGQFFLIIGEMQHIIGGNVRVQLFKGPVVQNRTKPVISPDRQMHPAVGAHIQAFGPDLAGGAAAALFAGNKLRRHPVWRGRTGIAAGFQLKAALLRAGRKQLFNGTHPAIPFRLPVRPDS